jgi:hypothetical protein
MNSEKDKILRTELVSLLEGGNAHISLIEALQGLPEKFRGVIPGNNIPYSIWQLVEHIRITQWDILEFSRNRSTVLPGGRRNTGRKRLHLRAGKPGKIHWKPLQRNARK